MSWWRERAAAAAVLVTMLAGCGYHVAGHSDLLPHSIKTIAVPAFSNVTTEYQLTDEISKAITREFMSRTRYSVVADPQDADAVLRGAIVSFASFPIVIDQNTGRASVVEVWVTLQVHLYDRNGKELYSRPSFIMKEQYEIAVNAKQFFDETPAALTRLSNKAAREIVSGILENF